VSDRPRLYTAAEATAELRMSERRLRDFLTDLGFLRGTRGARRMFTPADLDWRVEQRSWLTQAAGGVAAKTRAITYHTVHARERIVGGLTAQERVRELLKQPEKLGKPKGRQ
jgi:hypothetical protein